MGINIIKFFQSTNDDINKKIRSYCLSFEKRSYQMSTTLSPTNAAALKALAGMGDQVIQKIADATFKTLINPEIDADLEPKECGPQVGLATLVAIMSRQGSLPESLSPILKDAGMNEKSVQYIVGLYRKHVDSIRASLANVAFTYPRIIGCDWRLDYAVSNSETGSVLQPQFFVKIKLEGDKFIDFTCNEEEMVALVASLKDAVSEAARTSS